MIIDNLFTRPIFESQMDPITQFASNAHEEWRRNFDPTGTKPRVKKNSDGTEGDINVPFEKLHPDWKKENLAAAHAAHHAVKHFGRDMEKAAEHVHNEWIKRNPKGDWNAAQHVPYEQLPDDEKEKDRVHVRTMQQLMGHQPEQNIDEGSAANDYFTRRKSEEDRIAGVKAPAKNKKNPANTDYAKKRKQQDVTEAGHDHRRRAAASHNDEECSLCDGTGEGRHEGQSCGACGGSGVARGQYDHDDFDIPDKDDMYEGVAEGAPELLKKEMPLHRHAEKLLAQNGVSKDDPDYHHHLGNTIKHLRQFGNIDLINKQGVAEAANEPRYPQTHVARDDIHSSLSGDLLAAKGAKLHKTPGKHAQYRNLDTNKWINLPDKNMRRAQQGVAEGSGGNWYIRVNGKILNDTKFKPVIFSSEDEARSHAMKLADKKRIPLSQMKLTKSWMDAPEQGVAEGKPQKKADRYHINKDGKPATLASYPDKDSAVKDRDSKYPDAKVHQVGPRGKVKGEFEEGVAEGLDDTASATPAKNKRGRFTAWDDDEPMRLKCEDGEFRTIQEINMLRQKIGMKPFSIKSQQGVAESNTLMKKLHQALLKEGRVKELAADLKTLTDAEFVKKYGKAKAAIRKDMKKVDEGNANSGRRNPIARPDNVPVKLGRIEKLKTGIKHHADSSRYGGTVPDTDDDHLLSPASRHHLHKAVTPDYDIDEARTSAAQRLSTAWDRQRAKSDASLARTPSSIPKKQEPKKADPVPKTMSEHRVKRRALMAQMLNSH